MVKVYSRINTKMPISQSSHYKFEKGYYHRRLEELGTLQKQIRQYLGYDVYIEWSDKDKGIFEVKSFRYSPFLKMTALGHYVYQPDEQEEMTMTEINPPKDIEEDFTKIYKGIPGTDVFMCRSDEVTDDIIISRDKIIGGEVMLTEVMFKAGLADIRQGMISNNGGFICARNKIGVPLDEVISEVHNTSHKLRLILEDYIIF